MPSLFDHESVRLTEETSRWRARDVAYYSGTWERLKRLLPQFELEEYRVAPDMPANQHLRSVVRQPRAQFERPIPVGVVSNNYSLVQHAEAAERCLEGIRTAGVDTDSLECELGVTELAEWMNFRVYFPES